MAEKNFTDYEKEYWFHVSNQNEIPIFGSVTKSIDYRLLCEVAKRFSDTAKDKEILKDIIQNDPNTIDTLRTIVGITDKRMYLELSYIFNKYCDKKGSDINILGESIYSLKKHTVTFFKNQISKSKNGQQILERLVGYLEEHGIFHMLHILNKMEDEDVCQLVDKLLLPKEIQQEETKRRGHGAEQQLAILLKKLNVDCVPNNRHKNPMGQDDPNIDKTTFELHKKEKKKTWSMDLIIKHNNNPLVFVQGLIHSSDPGQYGVNKSDETVLVKNDLNQYNKRNNCKKELWGLVDGVGFVENPKDTIFKMLKEFDTFVQLKSLYKAGLKLHSLGVIRIEAIRFDMSFYTEEQAEEMYQLYAASFGIKKVTKTIPQCREIQAGKAWLYI